MNSIYSCKLYRASSRKSAIVAALNNPINTELLAQLDEHPKYTDDALSKQPVQDVVIEEIDDEPADPTISEADNTDMIEPVEEAVTVNACSEVNIKDSLAEILGMLNMDSVTHGVTRTQIKENEFWIFYNDNTNLNNIMTEVINKIEAANYSYLEFNRLARSDNALVFEINQMKVSIESKETA